MTTNSQLSFKFPKAGKKVVVVTDLMLEIETQILAVHNLCGFCVLYGSSGAGKTTLAYWMSDRANQAFNPEDPDAFKAVFYEVGKVKAGWGNEAKRAIRSLYAAVSGVTIDEGLYGRSTAEELADMVVYTMQKRRVQLVFVDEAGLLSLDAIGGLVLVSDKARLLGFNITIVLIGMDDLPQKLEPKRRPQIYRRIHDWCYFRHYDLEQTQALLRALHPHFASLGSNNKQDADQFQFVYEISDGLPGFITQFVSRFDAQYQMASERIDITFLRAVHLRTLSDMQDILEQSRRNGSPTLADPAEAVASKKGKEKAK